MGDLVTKEEAAELLAKATPGPWMQAEHVGEPHAIVADEHPFVSLLGLHNDQAIVSEMGDAALVAAAPDLAATVVALHDRAGADEAAVKARIHRACESLLKLERERVMGIVEAWFDGAENANALRCARAEITGEAADGE